MNRSKKFMRNTIASVFQQIIVFAIGMILPRVMLVCYGSEINGITSSIRQFINYFTLVEAGIGASAIFALYKPLAKQDHRAINSIVTAARRFYIQSGYIFTALTVVLAFSFPMIRKTETLTPSELGVLVLVLSAPGFLNFFLLSKYNVILTADQRSSVISIAGAASNIVSTAIIVSLAYLDCNVVLARALSLVSLAVQSLILYIDGRKKYRYLDFHAVPDRSAMNQRWDALYLQMLGVAQSGAPIILATIFIGYKAVSVYSIFYMVIGGINGLLDIFTSGLSASFGDVIARGEKATLRKTYQEFEFTYYALITVVYSCAFVLIMPFIRIYTAGITDADYNVPLVGCLMVINGFLYNLKTPQGMMVISAGLYRVTRWRSTVQTVILIGGGILLAPRYGLPGILAACILSNLYRDIDLLFYIPAHVTKLLPGLTLKRWAISAAEFITILLPFFFFPVHATNFVHWIGWAFAIFCYAVLSVTIIGCLLDWTDFRNSCIRIRKTIKRN